MNWKWITGDVGDDFLHGHACPEHLVDAVLGELRERYPRLRTDIEDGGYLFLDMPGMICLDRPTVTMTLPDGFRLELPCEDVVPFYGRAAELKMRPWGGHEFTKLHGCGRCLVLDRPLLETLLVGFDCCVEDAEERAEEFYRMTPNQALHMAQGLPQNVDLGPDRLERFVPTPKDRA